MARELYTTGYQCFHCLTNGVYWQGDFSFEDYGLEGEGIVHVCHCGNCGADIEYYVPCDPIEEEENAPDRREHQVEPVSALHVPQEGEKDGKTETDE